MKINIKKDLKNILLFTKIFFSRKRNFDNKFTDIRFITFRNFFPNGGAGGGGAVQSANKVIFGDNLNGVNIKYSFKQENKYSSDRNNELWDLYGAVYFAKKETKSDKNCVYITHDYATAFGLALLGKKYVLVSHIQGSRVEEKLNFGEKFTTLSELIIKFCEKYAFSHAEYVCFPSEGAYKYFCNSKYKIINQNEFKKGRILYNTLYAFPKAEIIEGIEKDCSYQTFLSVGQLTTAKGMDLHPAFFEKLLAKTNQKIRYIMVGQGILENQILNDLNKLKETHTNFEYIQIKKCTYPQMQYLQDISDVYLMLHRISIFDLTTLELMNKSKAVILSDAGGNPEFNQENNIILINENNFDNAINQFLNSSIIELGLKNNKVYNTYFSNEAFKRNYCKILKELING